MIHWYYFFPFCIFCNVGVCVCLLCYSFEWFTLTHSLNHSLGAIKSQRDNIKALNTEYFFDVWTNRQVHSHSIDISFPWRIFLNYYFFWPPREKWLSIFVMLNLIFYRSKMKASVEISKLISIQSEPSHRCIRGALTFTLKLNTFVG